MASKKKTCYYEVLGGLDRKCDTAEIKQAYRKLALKMHPDKAQMNGMSVEEATSRFQLIQEAYSVLSDTQERAWYDAHREQILKGDDEAGEDPFKTKINLYKFFSSSCYDGFGDKAGGFFAVYADLFTAIDTEEQEWEDVGSSDEEHVKKPLFGNSSSEWSDVSAFYRHWLDFCSRKAFGHADKWNPRDADNRQVRRAMEQENKKMRKDAKKEFNAEVRQLVRFVQKRDPRVVAHQKQQAKESAEKAQREAFEKERRKVAEEKERKERKAAQRREEEVRWKEAEMAKEARRARGEVVTDDEESEEEELVEYSCEACRKSFKSEQQFNQHCKSKKHQQAVAAMRKQMEKELREEAAAAAAAGGSDDDEDDDGDLVDLECGGAAASTAAPQKFEPAARAVAAAATPGGGDASDDESDDEDAFLARFANAKGRGQQQQQGGRGRAVEVAVPEEASGGGTAVGSNATAAGVADAESNAGSDSDGEEAVLDLTQGSKKAQKKAKQKALLLEKSQEREHVQELVSMTKKAQRAAKKEADPAANNNGVVLDSGAANSSRCAVCNEVFPSRSKMFQHIKETGHAALKEGPVVEDAKKKGKKKR